MQRIKVDMTLDLHGLRVEEAELAVLRVIRASANRGKSVAIVHGYGTGAIKSAIRSQIKTLSEIIDIWYGEDYNLPGLGGVTVVFVDK